MNGTQVLSKEMYKTADNSPHELSNTHYAALVRENPLIHMDPKSLKCEYEDPNLNNKSNGQILLQASPKQCFSDARGFSYKNIF